MTQHWIDAVVGKTITGVTTRTTSVFDDEYEDVTFVFDDGTLLVLDPVWDYGAAWISVRAADDTRTR